MSENTSRERRGLVRALLAITTISLALFLSNSVMPSSQLGLGAALAEALVTCALIIFVARYHFFKLQEPVSRLVLVFTVVIFVTPLSFAGIYGAFGFDGACIDLAKSSADALYFSYMTFTTVGYGDMAPLGYCRIVVSVQGMLGYMLLGTLASAIYEFVQQPKEQQIAGQ